MVYVLLAIIVLQMIALLWSLTRDPVKVNQDLMHQNRELLNRIQAKDLQTFAALQTYLSQSPEEEYIPRDDESEARRVYPDGLISDEEIKLYNFDGFGIDVDNAPVSDRDLSR